MRLLIIPVAIIALLFCNECGSMQSKTDDTDGINIYPIKTTEYSGDGRLTGYTEQFFGFILMGDTVNMNCNIAHINDEDSVSLYIRFNQDDHLQHYKSIGFSSQLSILDKMISKIKQENGTVPIQFISYEMLGSGDANIDITNDYLENNKSKDIVTILMESRFRKDIDSILSSHNLQIKNLFVEEGIYHLIDTDYFLKNNRLSDPNNCPDSILELYVGMCVGKKLSNEKNYHTCYPDNPGNRL